MFYGAAGADTRRLLRLTMSIAVVQRITTHWTKATRGGPRAAQRNAVPEAARLPLTRIPPEADPVLLAHTLVYPEAHNFVLPGDDLQIDPSDRPYRTGCIAVTIASDRLVAAFEYDCACGGAPERGWERKQLDVQLDQWVQFAYNGRFSELEGAWRYEKTVVNVGVFRRLRAGVFQRTPPTHIHSSMTHLF